jgi:hypothetical protein
MRIGLNVLGLVGALIGAVWMLQGLNILAGSFMSGQTQWFVIGAIVAFISLVLIGWANFARR